MDNNKDVDLLDEFIDQLQQEQDNDNNKPPAQPLEITDQVKERLITLMEEYLYGQTKIQRLMLIRKQITSKLRDNEKNLTTMMKLYGLTELIKGKHKFSLQPQNKIVPVLSKQKQAYIQQIISQLPTEYSTTGQQILNHLQQQVAVVKPSKDKLHCHEYYGDSTYNSPV